jgi:hypothetical protein
MSSLSDVVTRAAQTVGYLRVESCKNGTKLSLRELPLKGFIRAEDEYVDHSSLAAMIKHKSKNATMTTQQIQRRLITLSRVKKINRQVCCGHDLLNILTGILISWWSARVTYEGLCWSFRSALSIEDLKKLRIYMSLKAWGEVNSRPIWAS